MGTVLGATTYSIAVQMKESFLDKVGDNVQGGALVLACFFAVYVLIGISVKLFSGQPFPWQEIFRPFVLILVISFWSGTLGLFDSIGEHVYSYMADVFSAQVDSVDGINVAHAARGTVEGAMETLTANQPEMGTGFGVTPVTNANNVVTTVVYEKAKENGVGEKPLKSYLFQKIIGGNTGLHWIVEILYALIKDVMTILSQMYLCFFAVVGPFAFAFAVIPQVNRLSSWIATYIQYWLWAPTCSLINGMTNWLAGKSVEGSTLFGNLMSSTAAAASGGIFGSAEALSAAGATAQNLSDSFKVLNFSTVSLVAGLLMLLSVPRICSTIVNAGSDVISGNLGRVTSGILAGGKKLLGV